MVEAVDGRPGRQTLTTIESHPHPRADESEDEDVLELTGAIRINYAIFGNVEPALHAHVLPRFADEAEAMRTANPWGYDWSTARRFDAGQDGALLAALRARLQPAQPLLSRT